MIDEKIELNLIGKILTLMRAILIFLSTYGLFFLFLFYEDKLEYYRDKLDGISWLFFCLGLVCIPFICLYLALSNNIDQWIDRNFGRKVIYEVPDEPMETNHNSSGNSSQYTYKNSSGHSYSGASLNTTDKTSNTSAALSFSTSPALHDYKDLLSLEIKQALKSLEKKGVDWASLINKTDDERENLFIKELGNKKIGKAANEQFNYTDVYPTREKGLKTLINEAEIGEEYIKENLRNELKSFEGILPQNKFQHVLERIEFFEEEKRRKDNHIKYEGRLSNKDIKAIKEHLGYVCMGCGLDPVKKYGETMKNILEAHHKTPFSELEEGESRIVKPDDFLILCPTCHRMIHKLSSPDDLEGLKKLLSKNNENSRKWFFES